MAFQTPLTSLLCLGALQLHAQMLDKKNIKIICVYNYCCFCQKPFWYHV